MTQTFTAFISDLHLQAETPLVTERFKHFMQTIAPQAEALYILGDFFETWVGDDNQTNFNTEISRHFTALAAKKIPVYFMHGNRDFLLGKRYAQQCNFKLLPDPSIITLYNHSVILTHGDALCTQDKRHQKYRKIILNPMIQKILLSLPLRLRHTIANTLRKNSGKHNRYGPSEIMDITPAAAHHLMLANNLTLMIHGHTHRPNIHTTIIDNTTLTRIVLGAWHDNADYLKFYADGKYELETIS